MRPYQMNIISQKTPEVCWKATGRMMWNWKHNNNQTMKNNFNSYAGMFAVMNRGLDADEMKQFHSRLGLRTYGNETGKNASGSNLRHALQWSPVIISLQGQIDGHAVVVIDHSKGVYTLINPCLKNVINLETGKHSCTAGVVSVPENQIDSSLTPNIWYW